MADINTLKDKITSTIYPNGRGAITAESHQALLLEMADTIGEVEAAKADKTIEYGKNIVSADALKNSTDEKFYLPSSSLQQDDEHTFAMKADLKDIDTSALEKVVAAALTDLDTRVQELDAKIINSINAEY